MAVLDCFENFRGLLDFRSFGEGILDEVLRRGGEREYDRLLAKDKIGGYYSIAESDTGRAIYIVRLGIMNSDKIVARFNFACEKNLRLSQHPDHLCSYDSRDPENEEWGGAVRGAKHLHSFSGAPEEYDETFATLMAVSLGDMSFERAATILGPARNELYIPIVSLRQKVAD